MSGVKKSMRQRRFVNDFFAIRSYVGLVLDIAVHVFNQFFAFTWCM
jgi:hypothetical protein